MNHASSRDDSIADWIGSRVFPVRRDGPCLRTMLPIGQQDIEVYTVVRRPLLVPRRLLPEADAVHSMP